MVILNLIYQIIQNHDILSFQMNQVRVARGYVHKSK
jgi:hypothetical protein